MATTSGRRHMIRREIDGHARFLTFSCYDRLALFQNDAIKLVFVDQLAHAQSVHRFVVYAWVVMPEHAHLLIRPDLPRSPVHLLLRTIKTSVAKRVLNRWRELDAKVLPRLVDSRGQTRFWQRGGGYDRNIFSRDELVEKGRYIHENPVRRGLVTEPNQWPWSSALWYNGDRDSPIQITHI
jgi:putative transposase